jgi:hypothetical protein
MKGAILDIGVTRGHVVGEVGDRALVQISTLDVETAVVSQGTRFLFMTPNIISSSLRSFLSIDGKLATLFKIDLTLWT